LALDSSILTKVPLFADLSLAEIDGLSRALRRRRYAKGSLVHAAGAMGGDLYIIELGRVAIQLPSDRGAELTLRLLGPRDFFGEISLWDEEPWFADARAVEDCQLLLLAKRDFLDLLDKHPAVARRLLTIICKRLRHNAKFAQDLAFLGVPTRLARALVILVESKGWGWDSYPQESLLVEITQSALAAHVGATRESINKWLGYYERRGYIRCQRDSIVVLRLDELRLKAEAE
jgi:CRP/FNR family transcriptional regulator, cyclic AMP receptor protein